MTKAELAEKGVVGANCFMNDSDLEYIYSIDGNDICLGCGYDRNVCGKK